jgi:adenosylcobinamide-GDP ribazoletransferase
MRDHSIGAYGAVALTLDLIVKTAALAGLAVHHHALWPAIAAGAFSRSVPAVLGGTLPSVRSDGAGAAFRVTRAALVAAVAIAVGLAAALGGVRGLELAGIVAAGGFLLALCFRRWLGGVTGDLLGASVELTETLALVAAAALTGSH